MNESNASIIFDNVSFGYTPGKCILHSVSFAIKSSEDKANGYVAAIMGSSGAGKSTLLKLILGVEKGFTGTISRAPFDATLSYVPQEPVLFEHLSAKENARYFEKLPQYKKRFDITLFNSLVDTLNLDEVLQSQSVVTLSGGQRQRLSLLRALSIKPKFLLLDEPCTGLDADVKRHFLLKLKEIATVYNIFIIYITHHHDEAELIADSLVYMAKSADDQYVSKVFHKEMAKVVSAPPHIEIEKMFKFPYLNVIKILQGEVIDFAGNQQYFDYYLTCSASQFSFDVYKGIECKLVSVSPLYTQVSINGSVISVNAKPEQTSERYFVKINGKCNLYHPDGAFVKTINLVENKITTYD